MTTVSIVARAALMAFLLWYFDAMLRQRKVFEDEAKRNDQHEPPTERQLQWDLRHIREDIAMAVWSLKYSAWMLTLYVVWRGF